MKNKVISVDKNSIAEEIGIEPGDIILSINSKPILDVFDYRYLINDEYIEIEIKTKQGEVCTVEIEKDYYEDLGINFESGLMDDAKSCQNKCIFCFIDQLPKGMRDTLYFKDDDSRLSFLQGNYVTLTNMKEQELDRIIYYHLSPINISVHTTDMELRKNMLNNRFADKLMLYINKLANANIEMNFQIVLCRDINDGDILDKSIEDLYKYYPHAKSLSVVPVGITKYRDGLYDMKHFDAESSLSVIKQVTKWQEKIKNNIGTRFVFVSDEFYINAGEKIPDYSAYEDFPQIENGVGMLSLMKHEFDEYIDTLKPCEINKEVSLATGEAAYDFIKSLCKRLENKFRCLKINVYKIKNNFFGGKISVSGLLTGVDIIEQLKDKKLGEYLCLPKNILRAEETVLLDDIDINYIEKELNINIKITGESGSDFIKTIVYGGEL